MKLPDVRSKGRTYSVLMLMAGIGTAAALTLAPAAVGVAQAGATTPTPVTTTTTVATNGSWTSPQGTTGRVLVECPNPLYTTALTSTSPTGPKWIWATYGQTACPSNGNVPQGTVTLTTTFNVPGIPQGATLTMAADNGATVYVNDVQVAILPTGAIYANFETVHHYTITTVAAFRQGTNTITIVGNNFTPTPNPAGVIAKLTVVSTSTTSNLCKHTGWRGWTTSPGPFQNQGDCVSYFVKNPNGADPTIPNTASS